MELLEPITRGFVGILPYLAVAFALLLVFKVVHDRITPFDDNQALKEGNAAAGINRGGAYLGFLVAMSGSLISSEQSYWADMRMFLIDGGVAMVAFAVASYVFDKAILTKVNNAEHVSRGNKAIATVEACAYVGLGFIMSASFSGGGDQSVLSGLVSAVLFSAIGLVTLVVIYRAYSFLWRLMALNFEAELHNGNVAAGIDVGSLLLAMSITLWFSISGDFTGWASDILSYAIAALASMLAVSAARVMTALTLTYRLPGTKFRAHHQNVAKSSIVAFVSIGAGLLAGLVTFV